MNAVNGRPTSHVLRASLFMTKWGWGVVVYSSVGLKEVLLPRPLKGEILHELGSKISISEESVHPATSQLIEYFSGMRAEFELALDLEGITPFQNKVYGELIHIPYGQTRSYQELAEAVGISRGSRAVAGALAKNPIPIVIPCHRVIQKDGHLGGFSGGVSWKETLIQLERSYSENGRRNTENRRVT